MPPKEDEDRRRRAKTREGAITSRDVLRHVWISELQDRYHFTTYYDMERIIETVDKRIAKISDREARELL